MRMGSPKSFILSQRSVHRKDDEPQIIVSSTRWTSAILKLFPIKAKYVDTIFSSGICVVIS